MKSIPHPETQSESEPTALQDEAQARRSFLQRALTTVGIGLSATAVTSILAACETDETLPTPPADPITISIADYEDITGPGTIAEARIGGLNGGSPVFISQVDATTFAVFSTVCTHEGCHVSLPIEVGGDCICNFPCGHGSHYSSVDGKRLSGLASRDLKSFATTYQASTGILSIQP